MVTNASSSFTQGDDLSVRSRVRFSDIAIPPPPHDPALEHDNGAHWNLSGFERSLRASQCFFHPEFVRGAFRSWMLGAKGIFCGYFL